MEKRINFKKNLETSLIDFSSDRIPNFNTENEKHCLELLTEINLNELPFLVYSMTRAAKGVNARSFLSMSEIDINLKREDCTLLILNNFFKNEDSIYSHEGVYNTLNYIKNYIYYLLLKNNNLNKNDIFIDYADKYKMVNEQIADIANFLYEIRKLSSDKLKLSIGGNVGLYNTTKRHDTSKPLSKFQKNLVEAIAFGITYEKLEKKDYDDCKKLLFIEREKKKRNR